MPIKISNDLPARAILEQENIFVMTETRALAQDIRPLKILILNLMPVKITTETQILRQLSNTPLQIEIDLLQTSTYTSKNTPQNHLLTFYKTFQQIRDNKYDGMIITGAPVETMDFENVEYWDELCTIMEWSKINVYSTFHICWGAQAGLYYHYGVNKTNLPSKLSGIFKHRVLEKHENIFRGFDDVFSVPHSRNSASNLNEIMANEELTVLASSEDCGAYIVRSSDHRQFFVMGHSEYDEDTLASEYFRDLNKGLNPHIPVDYFTDNDPSLAPLVSWRSHAQLLYTNWLNYYVYQTTPYNIEELR